MIRSNRSNKKIEPSLHKLADKRVIYAFAVDREVKYIGICPKTNLGERMDSQCSNKNMPDFIEEELKQKKVVKIFALEPKERKYKDIRIDLLRGLENPLINQLDPEWNRILGKGRGSF